MISMSFVSVRVQHMCPFENNSADSSELNWKMTGFSLLVNKFTININIRFLCQ